MIEQAPVYWYDEIDSTSEEAKRRARKGETSPVWLAARQQTSGKGRLGREWISPAGNLFTTVLFPEAGGLEMAGRFPFAVALAVRDACLKAVPQADIVLKWPNDVRYNSAKLSGILIESGLTNGVTWVAIGIGLNVRYAPDTREQATICLLDLGAAPLLEPDHVLTDLRVSLAKRLEQARQDFEGLLRNWLDHADGHGEVIEAGPASGRIKGVFEDLASDGGLILRLPDGTRQTIRAGDVELVKQVN